MPSLPPTVLDPSAVKAHLQGSVSSASPLNSPAGRSFRVGFLTYDLQRHTEDALFEVARAAPFAIKVFPLYRHSDQELSRVAYRPATSRGRHLGVKGNGGTPEGLVSNPEWRVGLACARESDIVILKGLLGLGAIWCALCARALGRVVISTTQALPLEWERKRRWWIKAAKRLLLWLCQFHIYQNPAAIDVLTEVYNCSAKQMISAPYEGGASFFRRILSEVSAGTDYRREVGFDLGLVFLFAGTLHSFKGVVDIVRAAALLPQNASFSCVFVGPEEPASKEGATIDHFTRLARSYGVEHRVRFLGPVTPEKLAELYCAADVVLLPTHRDMFPKVLVEAALARKPLITTNACGSAGLIVQDGVNGFVIAPGNVAELAEAMTKLFDAGLRAGMGARSKEIVDRVCRMDLEVRGYLEAIARGAEYLGLVERA